MDFVYRAFDSVLDYPQTLPAKDTKSGSLCSVVKIWAGKKNGEGQTTTPPPPL